MCAFAKASENCFFVRVLAMNVTSPTGSLGYDFGNSTFQKHGLRFDTTKTRSGHIIQQARAPPRRTVGGIAVWVETMHPLVSAEQLHEIPGDWHACWTQAQPLPKVKSAMNNNLLVSIFSGESGLKLLEAILTYFTAMLAHVSLLRV
jgi:hypothetical protein